MLLCQIIGVIIGAALLGFLIGILDSYIRSRQDIRRNIVIANESIETLFNDAMLWSMYRDDYHAYRAYLGEEQAMKFIVQRYLIDNGLIGYRTERIEL